MGDSSFLSRQRLTSVVDQHYIQFVWGDNMDLAERKDFSLRHLFWKAKGAVSVCNVSKNEPKWRDKGKRVDLFHFILSLCWGF